MNIYFAGAVRSTHGDGSARLASRIAALAYYGRVLTEHMADPATVDGTRSDADIHAHDAELLARADVVIADVTLPSTGTGYMIARAAARGLPILALAEVGARISAMIAGSPDVAFRTYADDAAFIREVAAFFVARRLRTDGPKIFLAGKPGCGKGTLGAWLAARVGAPHISTGEVLRALPDAHPHAAEIRGHMAAGRLVPAERMRDIVAERLREPDCASLGFVLDGYPPSRADLDNLRALGIAPDLVLYIDVSDATSIARQVQRKARSTDTEAKARDRLATFASTIGGFDELAAWYPDRLVVRVDGERPVGEVEATVRELLDGAFGPTRHARSYWFVPGPPHATRVHLHVDGRDTDHVRAIARDIHVRHRGAEGQLKIYPIRGLALGPQVARLPVYRGMPNFHAIPYPAVDEAFITGRLDDGDRALMETALAVARERGGMVEVEEYLGEWTLRTDGTIHADAVYAALPPDHDYPAFAAHRLADIPRWELHHGFDLSRETASPPIALADLVARCAALGLDNGGWFLFANPDHWAYRSNEFSNDPEDVVRERLVAQARALQKVVGADVGFSLELVHGIWVFPAPNATAAAS